MNTKTPFALLLASSLLAACANTPNQPANDTAGGVSMGPPVVDISASTLPSSAMSGEATAETRYANPPVVDISLPTPRPGVATGESAEAAGNGSPPVVDITRPTPSPGVAGGVGTAAAESMAPPVVDMSKPAPGLATGERSEQVSYRR